MPKSKRAIRKRCPSRSDPVGGKLVGADVLVVTGSVSTGEEVLVDVVVLVGAATAVHFAYKVMSVVTPGL